ncbi:type II toxin-antitoxin system VapC family toxin [Acidisoma cellulosilytica]|uniref:Ribonuclease VapC n=1 Tax=Acidisoma cellulosilyticum TaxID=2802395 RepID=A0A963YY48_9PROT|nr:type II toxin-antitoxin system VapC family toxin [Acidisoma cellulosilyticum]MCB8879100.1 type II toxin-antitoxin system VapC family toxin [Acidisoma cellulosilyticum]
MIFVDASAMIALIIGEADADDLVDRLARDPQRSCSALSVWETVAGLCRSHGLAVPAADRLVRSFLDFNDIAFIDMGETQYGAAIQAYARFGKGRHPAGLNMGDCFAYACAKTQGATLLFKGDDFPQTDIQAA